MKHNWKRLLSVVLTLALLSALAAPAALAAEDRGTRSQLQELTLTPVDASTLELFQGNAAPEDAQVEAEPYALTDTVRVSIVLDKASTVDAGYSLEGIAKNAAAKAYRDSLKAEQAAMTASIESAIGGKLDVKWNLTLAANIISANVLYGQIETIEAVPGVAEVFVENRYEMDEAMKAADEPNMGTSTVQTGSTAAWAAGYTGAGSKVAIIDTGVAWDHQSFDEGAFLYALEQDGAEAELMTADDIAAVSDQLNSGVGAEAYINAKVPYGYCYVDSDYDVTHENDTQGSHGSHVAGISAANRYLPDGEGGYVNALTEVGVQGVAPDAQLVAMKVFGNGGGAYDSDYMCAIEDAIILGCDSANLSLGSGSAGFSFSQGYQEIMDSLTENGLVVAMSAGNSYSWYDTPYNDSMYGYLYMGDVNYATNGSPGSFINSLTVASVNNSGQIGMPIVFGDLWVFYNETSGYGNAPIATIASLGDLEYVFVDSPGVDDNDHVGAEGDDFLALGSEIVSGKVAICWRGSSSFFAKANAAVAQGAVAVIIANNQAGGINMNLTGYEYTAPCVSIYQADGQAILAQSEAVDVDEDGEADYYTGTLSVSESLSMKIGEETNVQTMSDFSSWGTAGSLMLKPELTAPGGSIYSVVGHNFEGGTEGGGTDTYESWSGTSMASPQVAGMAAVLGQYIRENGLEAKTGLTARQLINSLLMSTAMPLVDDYGDYWSLLKQGAGEANVGYATQAKSYILMDEASTMFPSSARDGKVKAELGDDPEKTGVYEFGFTVNPLTDEKVEYNLVTDLFIQWIAGNGGYGLLQDEATAALTLGEDYNVTYEVNGETFEPYFTVDADVNRDGETNGADAQCILDYVSGENDGSAYDLIAADANNDGEINTVDARTILEALATTAIQVEDEPVSITVRIELDPGMKAFIDYYYGQTYIEGFTYVEGVSTEEGEIVDVTHSIPVLAFYGSWTDAAMFDHTSVIDEAYGTGMLPYMNNANTNYMTVKDAEGTAQIYMGNPYTVEDVFPADRLAVNGERAIAAFNYMPIRNIGTLAFAVTDADGKVIGASSINGNIYAPYYYVNGGSWQNTGAKNFSVNKTLKSVGAAEGDVVTVGLYALPEYYAVQYAKETGAVEQMTSGVLDAEGLKSVIESGVLGEGAAIAYTVTVDNTAPEVEGMFLDLITGNVTVKAKDNQYIAYVGVMNKSGSKEYLGVVPEQSAPGEAVEVTLDLGSVSLPDNALLVVGDYAGNTYAAKFSTGSNAQQNDLGGLMLAASSAAYAPGSGNRWIELEPDTLYYNTSSGEYAGMSVYSGSGVAVRAAEYVEGYVFIATADGALYAAPISELDDAQKVGNYSDATEIIYDMAYNYVDGQLYVLGAGNVIYTMDLTTGELTPAVLLTLNGVTSDANKLAIDDRGTFYVANSGNTTSAKLFKFKLAAEEDEEEEDLTLIYGNDFNSEDAVGAWTYVDSDGDGFNWSWDGDTNIVSASYVSGASLTPDNWAISPAIDLSAETEVTFSIAARNFLGNWPETLALYAGTSADPDEMTKLTDDFQPAGSLTDYSADLSDFAGEAEVYVAIRHYNSYDQYRVCVDTVEVRRAEVEPDPAEEPTGPVEITVDALGTMSVYNYSNGGALAWDHNTATLYLAANYNATRDYDNALFTVDTKTGKAARVNSATGSANYDAALGVCMNGLFIVPGKGAAVTPADAATGVEVEPTELTLLRGQTGVITATVYPWTLEEKDVTFESADETIATVNAKGEVTGVAVGETDVTVTTVAAPNLTAAVRVIVEEAPVAELRGVIWDEDGKGWASVFSTDDTENWTGLGEVGELRWGALVDDVVYGSTGDTMYAFDADTYELTTLGGIVDMWIPSDADALPVDLQQAYAAMGYNVGRVIGPNNYGTYLTMLDPEAGSLIYFDLSDTAFGSDPMAVIAYEGRGAYDDGETVDADGACYFVITESGELYRFTLNHEGSVMWDDLGATGIDLTGVSDPTNSIWASLVYDEETAFLYLSLYNGADDAAHLYAISAENISANAEVGTFREKVWPVTGLYQYTPATDLTLKVSTDAVTLYEGESEQLSIKVKLGETNEYTVESSDPTVATVDETGLITAVREGTAVITVTTVDANEAGDQLTKTVFVTVKGLLGIEAFVTAQVSDETGDHFASVSLDGLAYNIKAEAPFAAYSAARTGDIYMIGTSSQITALDAEDLTTPAEYEFDSYYSSYPAQDIANYPIFVNEDGELDESKALFTTSLGWLVKPNYYGWNLSSYLPDMAAIAFAGTDVNDDGDDIFVYYLLTTAGILYEIDVNYAAGSLGLDGLLDTGITLADQGAASMAYVVDVKYNVVSGELEPNAVGLVIADNATKDVWFIDFQTGEVGKFGTIDADNISGLIGTYDVLSSVAGDYVPPEPPAPSENAVYTWSFENDPEEDGWTFVDADGDGQNWYHTIKDLSAYAYDGKLFITSASYANSTALTPDNWAVSPAIDLSEAEDPYLSLYVRGQDPDWSGEHYALYAGTSADPDEMTAITDELVATGEYENITAALTDFIGEEEVYVAIRHYNVSDMFRLNIDRVEIIEGDTPIEPERTVAASLENVVSADFRHIAPNLPSVFDGSARLDGSDRFVSGTAELEYLGVASDSRNDAANKAVGGLNSVNAAAPAPARPDFAALDENETNYEDTMAVALSETEDSANGVITAAYDPSVLTFESAESSLEYYSVHNDAETGVITFAYANAEAIAAETVLATLKFSFAFEAEEGFKAVVTVETKERNDNTAVSEEPVEVELGIPGAPVWTWTEETDEEENVTGYTAATVSFTVPGEEPTEVEATLTSETTDPTCEEAGKTVYTATAEFNGQTYTDTKEIELEALGHVWSFADEDGVVWAEDYSSVTVNMVCEHDPSHTCSGSSDEIDVEYDPEPTCTEEGYVYYSALVYIDLPEFYEEGELQPISVSIGTFAAPAGHSYGAPTWTWADDYSMAVATFTCESGDSVVEKTAAVVLDEETSFAPGCESEGENNYIATVTFNGVEYSDTASETVPATGHSYGAPEWTWEVTETEFGNTISAKAVFTCAEGDSTVEKTAMLSVESQNYTAPDCETAGQVDYVYTGTVVGPDGVEYTDTYTDHHDFEARGHNWTIADHETDIVWAEDHSSVSVKLTCINDESHVETLTITEIEVETVDPTCEDWGWISYSAEFSYEGMFAMLGDSVDLEPTSHDYEITYTWSDDNSMVSAVAVCKNDETHVVNETVKTTAETTPATCTEDGNSVFTAVFTNELFGTQTKTVVIEATGHTAGEAVRENEVAATCETAGSYDEVVYCTVCGAELSRETKTIEKLAHTVGNVVRENEAAATCTEDGSYDLVVYCTVCGEELARTTVTVPATGHTAGEAVRENEVAATCETAGSYDEVVYCTVCGTELSRETKTIEALGHDWGEPEWTWSSDHKTASAKFVCKTDESHEKTVEATVTSETQGNTTVYTATVELDGETITDSQSVTVTPVYPGGGGYSGGGGSSVSTYTVDVKAAENGKVVADKTTASAASTVKLTVTPDEGYELDALTVTDAAGNAVTVTDAYSFTMPRSNVTVTATFKQTAEPTPERKLFEDVTDESVYYFDPVYWAVDEKITTGVDADHFVPDGDCSRAEMVTFLWRSVGSPEPETTEMPFEDVAEDAWYFKAVLWAVENGITKGVSDTKFAPDEKVDRGQAVTFLFRLAKAEPVETAAPFVDVDETAFYAEAVAWAAENGITKGTSESTFSPEMLCQRSQIVTFLYNLSKLTATEDAEG